MITLDLGESTYESQKQNQEHQNKNNQNETMDKIGTSNYQIFESQHKLSSSNSSNQKKKYRSSDDDSLERDSKEVFEEDYNIIMESDTQQHLFTKNNQIVDQKTIPIKQQQEKINTNNLQIQIQSKSLQSQQNNNENTSSSLGKRNFKDFKKVQREHKEKSTNQQQMKNILIQDQNQHENGQIHQNKQSNESNNQQIKKKIQQNYDKFTDSTQVDNMISQIKQQKESIKNQFKGKSVCLMRTKSDNFNINQAQKSAEKLFNQQYDDSKYNNEQQKGSDQHCRGKDTPNFQNIQKGNINPQQMHQLCKSETIQSNDESYEYNQNIKINQIGINQSITIYQNEISNSQNDDILNENQSMKEEFINQQTFYNDKFEQPINQRLEKTQNFVLNQENTIYNLNHELSQQQFQTYQIIQNGCAFVQNLDMNNFPGNAQFNQLFQRNDKKSPIIRQLSFRSASNASSSNINTPIQAKRMKLHGSSSQFYNSFKNSMQNEICQLRKQQQVEELNQENYLTKNKLFVQNVRPRASGQIEIPFQQQSFRQMNVNLDKHNVIIMDSENKIKQHNLFNYPIQNMQTHQKKMVQQLELNNGSVLNSHYSQGQKNNMNINYLKNNNTQRSIQSLKENCPATSPKSLIERWYAKDNIFDEIYSDGFSKPKSNIGAPVDNDSNQAKDQSNVQQLYDSVKIKNQSANNYFLKQENQTFPKILLQNQLNSEVQIEGLGKTFSPSKLKHINRQNLELRKVQSEKDQLGLLFIKPQNEINQYQNDIRNRELHLDELKNADQSLDQNEKEFYIQNINNQQSNCQNQNYQGYQNKVGYKQIEEFKQMKDEFKNKELHRPKNIFTSNIQDLKSQGEPKTPVNNFGSLFIRTSQVSVTNTSMNDQSAFSSSLDTEGNHHYYGCAKKGKNIPQHRQFQVNQFRYPQSGKNIQQVIESEQQSQYHGFDEEAIADVGGSSFFKKVQIQNNQNTVQKELFTDCNNNSTQSESIYKQNQPIIIISNGLQNQNNNILLQSNINQIMQNNFVSSMKNEQQNLNQDIYNFNRKQEQQQKYNVEQQSQLKIPTFSINNQLITDYKIPDSQHKQSWLDKEFDRLATLGRGNFGQVIKCRNKTDNFEYAIKVTNSRIRNPNEKEYYLQEMNTLSALSVGAECPFIVRYFNSWIEDDRIHIVMELCEKSLRQVKKEAKIKRKYFEKILKDQNANNLQDQEYGGIMLTQEEKEYHGYIPERIIYKIMRDVLRGMNELHQKNIVHLDIKPENILIGKSGKYKIADLGMARFLFKISEAENIPEGDCRYLSKELLSKEVLNNIPDLKKSDIFSLGVTAFELISLVELTKNGADWRSLREGENKFSKEIQELYSPQLLDAIRMMLSPNTEDRPNAQILLDSVFQSLEQKKIQQLQSQMDILKSQNDKLIEFLKNNNVDIEQILYN